jgi:hypothetical protein
MVRERYRRTGRHKVREEEKKSELESERKRKRVTYLSKYYETKKEENVSYFLLLSFSFAFDKR